MTFGTRHEEPRGAYEERQRTNEALRRFYGQQRRDLIRGRIKESAWWILLLSTAGMSIYYVLWGLR